MSLYENDLDEIMSDAAKIGTPLIIINGAEYPCEPGDQSAEIASDFDGDLAGISATVLVPARAFAVGVEPKEGQLARYDGTLYRVGRVQKAVDGLEWLIGLVTPTE